MGFFDIFKSRESLPPNLGAILDSADDRADVPHISEVVAAESMEQPVWPALDPADVRVFGRQDQGQKSDCVAESRRKLKRIMLKVNRGLDLDFSSADFYRRRSNYPAPGMGAVDAIRLDHLRGMTLDALVPSDAVRTEAAANALQPAPFNMDVARVFALSSDDVQFTPGEWNGPAGTIQKTRKGVMAWFFFTAAEWSREVPIGIELSLKWGDARALRHSVVLIEPATYNGQRGFWIDDSAGFGGIFRRFITLDFYRARNYWASYPVAFRFERGVGFAPTFTGSVSSAQECLRYDGLFPSNVDLVDTIGPLTRKALMAFQQSRGLPPTCALDSATGSELKRLFP